MENGRARPGWQDDLPWILVIVLVLAFVGIAVYASAEAHRENKSLEGTVATVASPPFEFNGTTVHFVVVLEEGPLRGNTKEVLSHSATRFKPGDKVKLEWRERYPYAKPTELPTWEGDLWAEKTSTTSTR